jgi:HSP20 family protein
MIAMTRKKSSSSELFNPSYEPIPASRGPRSCAAALWNPLTDIIEDAKGFKVLLEIPGMRIADIQVKVRGSQLEVWGTKGREFGCTAESCSRLEREFGHFHRIIQFPAPVDGDGICTDYQNGILTVSLPKIRASVPRSIKIIFDN